MSDIVGRRPLKVRNANLAKKIAKWLSDKNVKPNTISICSVVFALLSAICLLYLSYSEGYMLWLLPLLAAVFIQCRLLCNLFDGMVAVEGGQSTASGELFNDIPDRLADPIILIAAGYASTAIEWCYTLGWTAALLAVLTAYIRTLAVSAGAPSNFTGPMAKQHRMALLTIACLATPIELLLLGSNYTMPIALIVVIVGCIVTIVNRIRQAYIYLEGSTNV